MKGNINSNIIIPYIRREEFALGFNLNCQMKDYSKGTSSFHPIKTVHFLQRRMLP